MLYFPSQQTMAALSGKLGASDKSTQPQAGLLFPREDQGAAHGITDTIQSHFALTGSKHRKRQANVPKLM